MVPLLAAMLVLQPVLDAPGPLRLATSGTGEELVHWSLDGEFVAETKDGLAAEVDATAGVHTLSAETDHEGNWSALARSEPSTAGIAYVPAWSAHAGGSTVSAGKAPPAVIPFVAAGCLLVACAGFVHVRRSKGRAAVPGAANGGDVQDAGKRPDVAPEPVASIPAPLRTEEEACLCEM